MERDFNNITIYHWIICKSSFQLKSEFSFYIININTKVYSTTFKSVSFLVMKMIEQKSKKFLRKILTSKAPLRFIIEAILHSSLLLYRINIFDN